LLLVGWADPPHRRPDALRPETVLVDALDLAVMRQDQVRAVAHQQPALDRDPHLLEPLDLLDERLRVDHDAVADDADTVLVEHARRDEPKHELLPADQDRMAGVVAALVAS